MMNEQSRTHPDGEGRLLSGVKLLVVEDEALIAMEVEEMIAGLGAEVVGSFSRVTDALQALERETVAGAILDIQLDGETTLGLVDVLLERGCPILFVTGGGPESIPETYRQLPRLSKPFNQVDLARQN
jgi:CheY-like chemotaxis protein